jgi:hypothetical protein
MILNDLNSLQQQSDINMRNLRNMQNMRSKSNKYDKLPRVDYKILDQMFGNNTNGLNYDENDYDDEAHISYDERHSGENDENINSIDNYETDDNDHNKILDELLGATSNPSNNNLENKSNTRI